MLMELIDRVLLVVPFGLRMTAEQARQQGYDPCRAIFDGGHTQAWKALEHLMTNQCPEEIGDGTLGCHDLAHRCDMEAAIIFPWFPNLAEEIISIISCMRRDDQIGLFNARPKWVKFL